MFITKADLELLAKQKALDAQILLENERYGSAYYLAGYAIEIGIKVSISSIFRSDTFPDKTFVNKIYSHKIADLINMASLKQEKDDMINRNESFSANWNIVSQWSEESRYELIDQMSAVEMVRAVNDEESGVLQWLKTLW